MKNITKEQIENAISAAAREINSNLLQDITDTFKAFEENTAVDMNHTTGQIVAAVSLVQSKTNALLEKVLTDLLCD